MHVSHDTALKYSALYCGVRVIAETVASLPWHVYRRLPDGSRERLPSAPAELVLDRRPNAEVTPFSLRETLVAHALTWGNGYAQIARDNAGRVAELWPIAPDRVEVSRVRETGDLVYDISNGGAPNSTVEAGDMFHLHGLGWDGTVGHSVVSLAARSIGLALAAEQFGASFFQNGTHMGGVLEHPATLGEHALENLKDSFRAEHGGPFNASKPVVLEEGMTWHQLGVPPEDAQFLETRELQVAEIARWLRLPPHKIGDLRHATFTNIEHQSREFVTDSIMPWTIRLEQEANRKLVRIPGAYTKLTVNALMRGDSQARASFYRTLWDMGVLSVNEIRAFEDLDPIGPDGDKRLVQLNLTTLERIGEEPPEPQPGPSPAAPEEDGEEQRQTVNRWWQTA